MAKYKVYQVFVSSTYEDLKEERLAVMNALIEKKCIPVGMEYFPACNLKQLEYIKKLIDEVDYYVLILAGKYGSIEKSLNKSYTQLEYEYAKSKNVPIATFVIKSIDELSAKNVERNKTKAKQLDAFRRLVMADKMCKTWSNKDELARRVQNAIDELVDSSPREGWVRPSSIVNQKSVKKDDEFDLDQIVKLNPIRFPLSFDDTELVYQTTWREIIRVVAPLLKTPVRDNEIEQVLRRSFNGISTIDIERIIDQLICREIVDVVFEGTKHTGFSLKVLSKKGWQVFGKAKGYL